MSTVVAAASLGAVLAACVAATPEPGSAVTPLSGAGQGSPAAPVTPPADAVPAQVALASTDLAVGHQRFAFSILDPNGALIPNVKAEVTMFKLKGENAAPYAQAKAGFYPAQLEQAGLYVVYGKFDEAGNWGAEISGTLPDGRPLAPQRIRFDIAEQTKAPAVGDPAPATGNLTSATEPDLAKLSTDPQPDPELYRLTVDEAAKSGRPTVVVFSTPALCKSRICGPVLDEVKQTKAEWADRVNFIHVEVYTYDAQKGAFDPERLSAPMEAWHLESEPWVFVLGSDGRIAERLEGSVTASELTPILKRVTGSS
jgi:hypothetical protein